MSISSGPERPVGVGQLAMRLVEHVQATDEFKDLWVEGEISGANTSQLGHTYFTLKDRIGGLRCVLFATQAANVPLTPRDGMKVLVHGYVEVYLGTAQCQIRLDDVRLAGLGEAWARREALKKRLLEAGLFAQERKRPLPKAPRRIGVVTSPAGAAWRDIQSVVMRRDPTVELIFAPAQVQGVGAADTVIAALDGLALIDDLDCVIVARGGGASDDLGAFDDEALARRIVRMKVPVCTGVGHETDVTIADLVADVRAATPSQAAELVVPDRSGDLVSARKHRQRIEQRVRATLALRSRRAGDIRRRLDARSPEAQLGARRQLLDEAWARVEREGPRARVGLLRARLAAGRRDMERAVARLGPDRRARSLAAHRRLEALSPENVLRRGYAIVLAADGGVRGSAAGFRGGEHAQVRMRDGRLAITVDEVKAVGGRVSAKPGETKGVDGNG